MNQKSALSLFGFCFFCCFIIACKSNDATPDTTTTLVGFTETLAKIAPTTSESLGKSLFYDPILSGKKDVACASCHHPSAGYSDNLDLSIGVNAVGFGNNRHFLNPNTFPFAKRNAQTVLNAVYNGMDANGKYDPITAPMFWDSRVKSLELQSMEPIKSLEEMRGGVYSEALALDSVVARLKNIPAYTQLFAGVFGANPQPITAVNIGKAIASFERTLTAMNSPFDRYKRGETTAMTALEIQGMNAFTTVGCANCHSGTMFSDYQLHVLSVPDNAKSLKSDVGNGTYAFRTASLRNLRFTAPYMHSGVFQTLNDVLRFYGRIAGGNSQNSNVAIRQVDAKIRDVRIQNNQAALVAFINALSDDSFDKSMPSTVPSKLNVGGNIR